MEQILKSCNGVRPPGTAAHYTYGSVTYNKLFLQRVFIYIMQWLYVSIHIQTCICIYLCIHMICKQCLYTLCNGSICIMYTYTTMHAYIIMYAYDM